MFKGQLLGNLGRDAELRYTPEQVAFVTFTVAQQQRKTNPPKPPVWIDCIWRGERAAKVAQYLNKGTKVLVSGDIALRTWEGRDQTAKTGLQVSVDWVEFAGGGEAKPEGGQANLPPARDLAGQQRMPGIPAPGFVKDDSVPF